jgi:hypothetical protein
MMLLKCSVCLLIAFFLPFLAVIYASDADSTSARELKESIFRPDIVYKFKYDSEVTTGVPSLNNAETTRLGLRADCYILGVRTNIYLLQLDNVKFYHKFTRRQPDDVTSTTSGWSDDAMLSGDQSAALSRQLVKRVKFRYQSGDVAEVWFNKTDEYWSMNIKKGLLSLLQLNLNQRSAVRAPPTDIHRHSQHQPSSSSSSSSSTGNSRLQQQQNARRHAPTAYSVMEADVTGECETNYVITTASAPAMSHMFVTKTRNFDSCHGAQSYVVGFPEFLTHKNAVNRMVTTDYVLTGDRHNFLVQSARVTAQYHLTLFARTTGPSVSTHVTQVLNLTDTTNFDRKSSGQLLFRDEFTDFVRDKRGLGLEVPSLGLVPADLSTAVDDNHREFQQSSAHHRKAVDRKLETVIDSMYPSISDLCTRHILELHHILRHLSRSQLRDIITAYNVTDMTSSEADRAKVAKKRDILLSLLPSLPSDDVVHVLSDLILTRQLGDLGAVVAIGQFSLLAKPTPVVVNALMSLNADLSRQFEVHSKLVQSAVLLGAGTVTNRMLMTMHAHRQPNEQILATADAVVDELERLLEEANTDEKRLLILDAMSNVGSRSLIPVLKAAAENMRGSQRVAAVLAMRKLAKAFRSQVHPILLSLFTDRRQPVDVRSAAVHILVNSQPSPTMLQLLVHSLDTEPSDQIRSLVYSSIVCLAKHRSGSAELQRLSNKARLLLRVMRPMAVHPQDSQSSLLSYFSEKRGLGLAVKLDRIKSARSKFPDILNGFSVFADAIGDNVQLAEFVFSRHFSKVASALFGELPLSLILSDIITGQPWSVGRLVDSLAKLEISGTTWNSLRKPFISKSSNTDDDVDDDDMDMDNYWRLLVLDHLVMSASDATLQSNIEQYFSTLSNKVPDVVQQLGSGYDVDLTHAMLSSVSSLIIPTTLGVTFTVNVSSVSTAKVNGRVKASNLESLVDAVVGGRKSAACSDVHLTAQLQPSLSVLLIGNVGVDVHHLATGSAFKASLNLDVPVDVDFTINPHNLTGFNFRYNMPQQDTRIAKVTAMPFNFIHYFPPTTTDKLPFETRAAPITDERNPRGVSFQRRWKIDKLDAELELNVNRGYEISVFLKTTPNTANDVFLEILKSEEQTHAEKSNSGMQRKQQSTTNHRSQSPSGRSSLNFTPVLPDDVIEQGGAVQRTQYIVDVGMMSSSLMTSQVTVLTSEAGSQLNFQLSPVDESGDRTQVTVVNVVVTPAKATLPHVTELLHGESTLLKVSASWPTGVADWQEISAKLSLLDPISFDRSTEDKTFWWQRLWQAADHDGNVCLVRNTTQSSRVQVYKLHVDFSKFGSIENELIAELSDRIKYNWLPFLTVVNRSSGEARQNDMATDVSLLCQLDPAHNKMSLTLRTPRDTVTVNDAPLDTTATSFLATLLS